MLNQISFSLLKFLFAPECLGCGNRLSLGQSAFCSGCVRYLLISPQPRGALLEHFGPAKGLVSALRESAPQRAAAWMLECLDRRGALRQWKSLGVEVVAHAPQNLKGDRSGLAILTRAIAQKIDAEYLNHAFCKRSRIRQHGRKLGDRMDVACFVELTCPAEWVKGKQVLVLDDVQTTGTTLDLCSYILRKAGASKVRQFALAKQVMNGFEGKQESASEKG